MMPARSDVPNPRRPRGAGLLWPPARALAWLVLLLAATFWAAPARAASGCTVLSTTPIVFGLYDPMGLHQSTALDGAGAIEFECNGSVQALAVLIDQGQSPAAGSSCAAPARRMSTGAYRLNYQIYTTAGRTQAWGCQAANDVNPALSKGQNNITLPIYGRIPPAQDPSPGLYSDTLTITLVF